MLAVMGRVWRVAQLLFIALLLTAAVVAYGQDVVVAPDLVRLVVEAGPAAAAVCYFLWRLERATLKLGETLRGAVDRWEEIELGTAHGRHST